MRVFRKKRLGFNAIELAVVVLLVFLLVGVIAVALRNLWENERRMALIASRTLTNNNLKQLVLACHSFHDVHKKLPPAFDKSGQMDFPASLHVHLLPYIEQDNLYKIYLDQKGKGAMATNAIVPPFLSRLDLNELDNGAGIQNFAGNLRVFSDKGLATKFDANMPPLAGIEPGNATIPASFLDGTSFTIFFATKFGKCQDGGSRYVAAPDSPFAAFFGQNAALVSAHPSDPTATFQTLPLPEECLSTPLMAQSMSKGGLSVGLGDGSIRMIGPSLSPRTWNLVLQPNDGLQLGDDW
jgi:hypothetical protein